VVLLHITSALVAFGVVLVRDHGKQHLAALTVETPMSTSTARRAFDAVAGRRQVVTPASRVKWIVIVAVLYFSGTEAETVGFRTGSPRPAPVSSASRL
jgi:hypothetical protein